MDVPHQEPDPPADYQAAHLPQKPNYCCDNIHSWISLSGDQHLVISMEFTVLNSPKGFWRSLPEISLLFSLFCQSYHLRPDYQSIGAFLLCIRKAECLASSSQTTGSHPSWSSLLHFYLFLVHFYSVVDSTQFRC